ncbi:MAG: hypothetical protein GX456_16115 [Verrucomicrobia bacterium]|nr:hypothetical protein [Verrucomicrobiota bacterium]
MPQHRDLGASDANEVKRVGIHALAQCQLLHSVKAAELARDRVQHGFLDQAAGLFSNRPAMEKPIKMTCVLRLAVLAASQATRKWAMYS